MNRRVRQVSYFLSSQHFSDGLRITLSILLPSLLLAQVDQLATGMAISLGALSVSISDAPGPNLHRRNAMAVTVLTAGLVTLVTGFARLNAYALGLEILVFSFLFSMFAIYGTRATSVGNAALLVMILMLERPLDAAGVLRESGLIVLGGLWYAAMSLLTSRLQPYRLGRQTLGQCIHEIAKLLAIKADFYTVSTPLDEDYRRLIAQQVVVSEKQDAVREILFRSRQFAAESTRTGRLLLLTFVDVVDLYEQIMAMYYDYAAIRERFGNSGVLPTVAGLIRRLSVELDYVGLAVQSPVSVHKPVDFTASLNSLKGQIDVLDEQPGSTLVLKKILISLRTVSQRLTAIQNNLVSPTAVGPERWENMEFGRFITHQEIDVKSLRDNLALNSAVFRHAVRVALAMLLGFVITRILPYGHHSYWVLLTISVILKPAFSLTRQRNVERISGTVAGGAVGLLILLLVPGKTAQFVFMMLFMLGTYSAQRVNYIVMVFCVTPFVLILFSFLGISYLGAAEERLFDTLLGGAIALAAGYLLFPKWESDQLVKPMRELLAANRRYMQTLLDGLSGRSIKLVDYRLARKDVYVTSANLSAAFERMLSEPKHKQRNEKLIYEFVVLNHILSANVATITSALVDKPAQQYRTAQVKTVRRALNSLTQSQRQLDAGPHSDFPESAVSPPVTAPAAPDDPALNEQLTFIQQISSDIGKLVERLGR